jgi:hypothetical protein
VIAASDTTTTTTTTTSADCQFVTSKDKEDGQDGKQNLNAPQGGAEILPCVGGLIVCASRRWAAPATQDACHTEPDWIGACLWERFPIHLQGASATDATVARQTQAAAVGAHAICVLTCLGRELETRRGNRRRRRETGDGKQETMNQKPPVHAARTAKAKAKVVKPKTRPKVKPQPNRPRAVGPRA